MLQLATTVVIARLLGPTEYGFAAVILVFGATAELLRSSGFVSAVLQRRDLTARIASSLHYCSIAAGLMAAVLLIAVGPLLGDLLDNAAYSSYVALVAVVLPIAAAGAIPAALLARNLTFRKLVVVEVVAITAGCAAGIVLAVLGAGAYALIWQFVVSATVLTAGTLLVCPWKAGSPSMGRDMKPYLRFGAHASVVQGARFAAQNTDRLAIGAVLGPTAAGLYSQANQLILLPIAQINGPLTRIVIPVLGRLVDQPFRYRHYFRTTVAFVGFALWPAFASLAVLSEAVITTLFGTAWSDSSGLFRILVLAGFAHTLTYVNSWLFVSTGRIRRQALWTVATTPLAIAGIVIGLGWGAHGVAVAVAATSIALVIPGFLVASHGSAVTKRDFLSPLLWPLVVTAIVGGSVWGVAAATGFDGWPLLVTGGLTALAAYGVCLAGLAPARRELTSILTRLRN